MFGGARKKSAKARDKRRKDSENIVREEKGRKTKAIIHLNPDDDYFKNILGIDASEVKEIRDIVKTRKQQSIDGLNENKDMAASPAKTVNASGNEEKEECARSSDGDSSDEDTEDQLCGTCKSTVDGDCMLCEICNKQTNIDGTMSDQERMKNDPNTSTSTDEKVMNLFKKLRDDGELEKYLKLLRDTNDDPGGASATHCGHCMTAVGEEAICCDICNEWFHFETECAGLNKKYWDHPLIEMDHIKYFCKKCKDVDLSKLKKHVTTKNIEEKLESLKTTSDTMTVMMQATSQKIDNVNRDVKATKKEEKTYADTLKTKNILIIKSKSGDDAAKEMKTIMSKVKTPIREVKKTQEGHLYVRCADSASLEAAKREIEEENKNMSANIKGKLRPKIKLVNVSEDEDKDSLIEVIKMKNPWINYYIENDDDLKIIKDLKARNDKCKHYIIKCTPKIRKAIYENSDELYTLYSNCNVYDCYMPYQCFKCQEFGHNAKNCRGVQVCPKCSGDHMSGECNSNETKCKNCEKKGYSEINHKSYDGVKCKVYKEEIAKAKNNTDHGFN